MSRPDTSNRGPMFAIVLASAGISLFLLWIIYWREPSQEFADRLLFLPALNAFLNGLSAVFLVLGYRAIRSGEQERHRRLMLTALSVSALFLVSYVTHHTLHGDTRFLGEGLIRWIYFFVLISHILLSVVALPLILTTVFFGLSSRFERHRRIARFTLPVWLYISVTGVAIFVMIVSFNP